MLYYLAVALYIVVCLFLIIVVLLQPGKGEGMGAAFGGSSTGSVFGGRGASTVLTKMTTGAAVLFMLLSIVLARYSTDSSRISGTSGVKAPSAEKAEAPKAIDGEKPSKDIKPAAAATATKTN